MVGRLIVATSSDPQDDAIESLVGAHGVACVRGSETDVLGRFIQVIDQYPTGNVVRICADSPLTDPEQIDALVTFFQDSTCDYAYNNASECGLPGGLGGEIVSARTLRLLDKSAVQPEHREHVTSFLLDNRTAFRICIPTAPTPLSCPTLDLDVDYPEDLKFLQELCDLLPVARSPFWTSSEIIRVLFEHQDLALLRHRRNS
jgi:spore coat polysaccharide biosynthesis protein SpsF